MSRRVLLLAGVNVALGTILIVGLLVFGREPTSDPPLTRFPVAGADAMTIAVSGETIELVRTASGWDLRVGGDSYPARSDRVIPFLEAITDGRILRRVTSDSDLLAGFGLGAGRERVVRLRSDGRELDLRFGAPSATTDSIHVRFGDAPSVVVATVAIDSYLRQPASFWAYLRAFPESARAGDLVQADLTVSTPDLLSFTIDYEHLRLARDAADRWSVVLDEGIHSWEIGHSRATSYLRELADLVGSGFYDGTEIVEIVRMRYQLSDGRRFGGVIGTDGESFILEPSGPGLPGESYGGLRYTLTEAALRRLLSDPAGLGGS